LSAGVLCLTSTPFGEVLLQLHQIVDKGIQGLLTATVLKPSHPSQNVGSPTGKA
jgi:hypothetical protein